MSPGREDPRDRRYNRPFRRTANEPGDRLWRDDHLYDLIIEIDHNVRPRGSPPRQRRFSACDAARRRADGGVRGVRGAGLKAVA